MTLFERINRFSPGLKNIFTHFWYQFLALLPYNRELLFMNYGYDPAGGAQPALEPGDEPYRLCIQLYHHTVADTDISGKQVLEVGCGRGGGASYIARYLKPRSMTGLDFAARVIRSDRKQHQGVPNLIFLHGSALALPFAAHTLDAVINVESSHTYPSFTLFCREVYRVLKPRGWFLFTDLRDTGKEAPVKSTMLEAGFTITEEENINTAVIRSMEADHERKCEIIAKRTPFFLHTTLRQFSGTKESMVYRGLVDGSVQYLRYKAYK